MQYPTEPLETYRWGKEYRSRMFKEISQASEGARPLIIGNMNFPKEIITGIGDFNYMAGESYAVSVIREGGAELAQACAEETERRGFARDLCAYARYSWGSMFLNRNPWGGAFPSKPAFVCSFTNCESRTKWFQVMSEHLGVPHLSLDCGFVEEGQGPEYQKHCTDYMKGQFEAMVEQMERITGKRYNWDLFVEGVANRYLSRCYLAEAFQLNGAVPAPMEQKLWLPFLMINEWVPYTAETVAIMKALCDEIKSRIARGIAADPQERIRITHEGMSPYHSLFMFSYLRQRGVAMLGWAANIHHAISSFEPNEDGSFSIDRPILWNKAPRTRAEALEHLAYHEFREDREHVNPIERGHSLTSTLRRWKADGAIFVMDRGCAYYSTGVLDVKRTVQEAGIPTMLYEGNRVDAREWSWPHVQDALDTFLESLGVHSKA
ncbi:MAG: 2-hydroxyacyl-CoA dehydratase [Chloroflexi bacterium]|nr:2-hydroxyacyl-CoA dehydratase [Chloroflexota bacterium]